MGQSEAPLAQSNMGDPPLLFKLLVGLGTLTFIAADPNVFEEYFDDGMKLVDVSQDIALRSCLSNGNTAEQTKTIYDKCYGEDFNFEDLAQSGSSDSDGDGLPDDFEGKETCFYKGMGWVSDDNELDEKKIRADMIGLDTDVKKMFDANVGTCMQWSGNFGQARKKRSVQDGEDNDVLEMTMVEEDVPNIMDNGRRAMGWVRSLVRKSRSAEKGKKKGKGKGNKNRNSNKKGKKKGKGKGNKNRKDTKKEKGKDKGKGNEAEQPKENNDRKGGESIPEETYNKLWCIDLAVEQALEKCVENKITN